MKNKECMHPPQSKYEEFSAKYDFFMALPEFFFLNHHRRDLIRSASGEILEIAAGTGRNFVFYDKVQKVTAIDASPSMLEISRKRILSRPDKFRLLVMDAENLDFPDGAFDTVVSSLALCSISDPIAALREMSRVCRLNGRILLIEHGRSSYEPIGKWQDRIADRFAQHFDCHMNRKPVELVEQAGLKIVKQKNLYWGIVNMIEARPG